jgi:ferric iron reductase protein FhuF
MKAGIAVTQIRRSVLQETLDHLNQATGGQLQARIGRPDNEPDWVTGTEILADPDAYLPEYLHRLAIMLGGDSRKVVASFFLKDWLRQVVLASTGSYLLQRRIPEVDIRNLAFRVTDEGRVGTIAFLDEKITVSVEDPCAERSDVRTVSPDVLRAELCDTVAVRFAGPFINALRPHVPVGERFMWATTADTVVGFILLLGMRLQLPAGYREEADALAAMEPLKGKTGTLEVACNDRTIPVLARGCCCFAYHLDQYEHCKTCPLLPVERRIANVQAEMLAGRQ